MLVPLNQTIGRSGHCGEARSREPDPVVVWTVHRWIGIGEH